MKIQKIKISIAWNGKKTLEGLSILMASTSPFIQMYIKTHSCLLRINIPTLSMYYLQVHTNQDIKRRCHKDKDSTVHGTAYPSNRNTSDKPGWARIQT